MKNNTEIPPLGTLNTSQKEINHLCFVAKKAEGFIHGKESSLPSKRLDVPYYTGEDPTKHPEKTIAAVKTFVIVILYEHSI